MSKFAISLLVVAAALCTLAGKIALAEEAKCEGTIAKIEGNNLTVKAGSEQHDLTLSPATKITLDGKPAKSTDLKVGYKVKCAANKEGAKAMCTSVDATTASE